MPPPQISVLLPAYNEELLLAKTIECVHSSFAVIDHSSYEIVVCDNNSTDDTARIAAARGARVVFEPHNQIARARNTAAREALGKWFIFLDADTVLNPGVLHATIRALQSRKVSGGGAMLAFDRRNPGFIATALVWLWNRASLALNLAAGSYIFCLQEAWRGAGGFDESYYACEELVFSRQLKRWGKPRGLKFKVLPGTRVETSARKIDWYGQWQLAFKFLFMARPNAVRNRQSCDLWYSRPPEKP
jgi:GT2 family glycosyltransferase